MPDPAPDGLTVRTIAKTVGWILLLLGGLCLLGVLAGLALALLLILGVLAVLACFK